METSNFLETYGSVCNRMMEHYSGVVNEALIVIIKQISRKLLQANHSGER